MKEITTIASMTVFLLLLFQHMLLAQATYCESNGVISMEAEDADAIKGWKKVAGYSGSAMEDTGPRNQGYLRFKINFTQTGKYYMYLLCKCGTHIGPCADTNDAFIELDGEQLWAVDDKTRVLGMRTHCGTFCWENSPKVHDPEAHLRNKPVYFKVNSPGVKTLEIRSRGKGFTIDKVALKLDDPLKPSALGPAVTFCSGVNPTGPITTVEAEAMTLDGIFKIDTGTKLNGTAIVIDATLPQPATGTATTTFAGTSGSYNVKLSIIPENDGAPKVKVFVGTQEIINDVYPVDGNYYTLLARINLEANGVTINNGDVIKIEGTADSAAYARIDKITFESLTATSIEFFSGSDVAGNITLTVSPNPMSTRVNFGLIGEAGTQLGIFDKTGKTVKHINGNGGGLAWDGRDTKGFMVKPGIYFYMVTGKKINFSGSFIKN